jgi:3-oxoacyl-[acyl-carrier-protein] synthase II
MRVAVTGVGAVTCCGNTATELWTNIKAGNSGIRPIEGITPKIMRTRRMGQVRNFELDPVFDPRYNTKCDRHIKLALNATKEALDHSGLDLSTMDMSRIHTVIGTCAGGYEFILDNNQRNLEGDPTLPNFISGHLNNMMSAYVNMHFGIQGSGLCVVGACASGNQSLAVASMLIELGLADVVVAGASDTWISEVVVSGFESLRALSFDDIMPRPFDKNRNGFAISEGSGILVLESDIYAKKRGANILAYLSGYGISADAYNHPTSPDPNNTVMTRTIRQALTMAGITSDDISYINAHATATKVGDSTECQHLAKVFGTRPYLSGTKSMTGHSIGSTSAIESVISVLAIRDNIIPGTINLETLDEDCPGNHVTETIDVEVNHVINNSFGFGGTTGILVFSK